MRHRCRYDRTGHCRRCYERRDATPARWSWLAGWLWVTR